MGKPRLRNSICENCGREVKAGKKSVKTCSHCTKLFPDEMIDDIVHDIMRDINNEL